MILGGRGASDLHAGRPTGGLPAHAGGFVRRAGGILKLSKFVVKLPISAGGEQECA
jgi:hypothetical protein